MAVVYLATSLDGRIADRDGSVGWLEPFEVHDYGFASFWAGVASLVLGRRTYDQVRAMGVDWPYAGKPAVVLTRRPLDDEVPEGVVARTGDLGGVIATLPAPVWLVGGSEVVRDALAAGLVDRLELFVMPVILGAGPSFTGPLDRPRTFDIEGAEPVAGGVVRLVYRRAPVPG